MIIQGKARYAKVNELVWGYENAHKEWTTDVVIDDATIEKLTSEGYKDNIKTAKTGEKLLTFRRKEFKADGKANNPIRVVGPDGKTEWDKKVKIGNGSIVNVNFAANEYKKGKYALNILSMQVWEHVPYEGGEFAANPDAVAVSEDWSAEGE